MTFPERLVELQETKGIDKKDVFTACNIARVSYYRYETGERTPTMEALISLADYYDVSLDYLVGRSDIKERR